MGARDDDEEIVLEISDWEGEDPTDPTIVTAHVAVPRPVQEEKTVPRCMICAEPTIPVGGMFQGREVIDVLPGQCARAEGWAWCGRRRWYCVLVG